MSNGPIHPPRVWSRGANGKLSSREPTADDFRRRREVDAAFALNRAAFALGQLVGAGALSESVVVASLEDAAATCGLLKDDGIRSVRATLRSGLEDGIASPRNLSEVSRAPAPPQGGLPVGSRAAREQPDAANGGAGGGDDEPPDAEVLRAERRYGATAN